MLKTQDTPKPAVRLALVFCLAAAVLLFGVQGASARSDHAAKASRAAGVSWLYNQYGGYVPVHNDCASPNCPITNWVPNGTRFQMVCWVDSSYSSYGNYWTNRWFYGYYYYSSWGWRYFTNVQASYVYYQSWVPHC